MEIQAPSPGMLLYRDGYDTHWRAFIDGARAKLYRADLGFKALCLPAGFHSVVFEYKPVFFMAAAGLYLFLVAAVPLAGLCRIVFGRRAP